MPLSGLVRAHFTRFSRCLALTRTRLVSPPHPSSHPPNQANEELDALRQEKQALGPLERTKAGMVAVLERSGFWGLVAMASWPNAAFDLCGICCGNFGMPFWTFLGATALGKGLIKAPLQCAFFSSLFSSDAAVASVASVFPASWGVREKLTATLNKAASGGLGKEVRARL